MKGIKNIFGIIAAAALIVSFAACAEDEEDPPPPANVVPSGHLGAELKFVSEQVYTAEHNIMGGEDYTEFTSDKTFIETCAGTPTISSGKFSYTGGTPTADEQMPLDEEAAVDAFDAWTGVTVTPNTAKMGMAMFTSADSTLSKENTIFDSNTLTETYQSVKYVYVDADVTIKGTGKTDAPYSYTIKSLDLNLGLKQGWNAIYDTTVTNIEERTKTVSMAVGHPALKWVLFDFEED
jgi:hypothetical protein